MNARARAAVIIAAVVLLDRVTKLYIRAHVSPWDTYPVIPKFFNIVHTENPGAAFGMLADSPGEWRGFLLVGISLAVMVAIAFMLWRAPLSRATSQWGLSLVFGGALGNVWDRMFRGMVTDFLQFFFGSYEFPAFNAADSAITIGAGLLLIDLWKTRQATRSPAPLEK
jgi:signal peptidase II